MEKIFFMHIPKSGGTSFIKMLNEAGYGKCFFYAEERFLANISKDFIEKELFQAGHVIGRRVESYVGETHHILGLVRNPIEVFMSTFNYIGLRNANLNFDPTSKEFSQLKINEILDRESEFFGVVHPNLIYLGLEKLEFKEVNIESLINNSIEFAERHDIFLLDEYKHMQNKLSSIVGVEINEMDLINATKNIAEGISFESLDADVKNRIIKILEPDLFVYNSILENIKYQSH